MENQETTHYEVCHNPIMGYSLKFNFFQNIKKIILDAGNEEKTCQGIKL
jgi:hypothetical protein